MYVHVHALALIRYIVIPFEQHVTELAAFLPINFILILDPCVSRTQHFAILITICRHIPCSAAVLVIIFYYDY